MKVNIALIAGVLASMVTALLNNIGTLGLSPTWTLILNLVCIMVLAGCAFLMKSPLGQTPTPPIGIGQTGTNTPGAPPTENKQKGPSW